MPDVGKCTLLLHSLLITLCITSCSGDSSSEDLNKEIQNVSSWSTTAYMVGDAWIHGAVPQNSAEQTLKTAEAEILKERENIEKMQISQQAIQHHKSVFLAKALLLANKTKKISRAIAQANRKEVQKSLEELEVESKMLKRLRKVSE